MSEYWVSKKKYFCKYCEIYIADDAPSRQQHEGGLRHKGNVERFIRGLYKGSEKRKKDLEDEKRDIARLELAAQAAYTQDVASGLVRPGSSSAPVASTSTAPRKPAPKPSNPYVNYSTAESLGYTDPDAERLAAEAERRRAQGVVGEWEVVTTTATVDASALLDEDKVQTSPALDPAGGVKREAETLIEQEDSRHFKLRKKTLGSGLGEIYDPGAIPIKLKKKEETPEPTLSSASTSMSAVAGASETDPRPSSVPKWTKIQWKRPKDDTPVESTADNAGVENAPVKVEEQQVNIRSEKMVEGSISSPSGWSKVQFSTPIMDYKPDPSSSSSAGSMFRKRKVPAKRSS